MRHIAVVIPSRTTALLAQALKSIEETHCVTEPCEIIVVDDGLDARPDVVSCVRYLPGLKPFCFARNVNLGMKAAAPDCDVVLLNDDVTFISSEGLPKLAHEIAVHQNVGILTPAFARMERTPSQRCGHLPRDYGLWIEPTAYVTFAAVYIRREVINRVGYLDERFVGYGYEDNDYCLRVRRAGYDIGVLPSVIVGHGDEYGRAATTFRMTNLNQLMAINRHAFVRKWSAELLGLSEEQIQMLMEIIAMM
jgi:GT2 family glycosyltransferase